MFFNQQENENWKPKIHKSAKFGLNTYHILDIYNMYCDLAPSTTILTIKTWNKHVSPKKNIIQIDKQCKHFWHHHEFSSFLF